MVLNELSSLGVLMLQDEMNLVRGSTFIRSKHNGVWRFIIKFLGHPPSILGSKVLKIGTTTFQSFLKANFILEDNSSILKISRPIQLLYDSILLCLLTDKKPIIIMSLTLFTFPYTYAAKNSSVKSKYKIGELPNNIDQRANANATL